MRLAPDGALQEPAPEPLAKLVAVSKVTAVGLTLCYGLGFIVLRSWGATYGIGEFPFLNTRYLSAGLLLSVVVCLGLAGWIPAVTLVGSKLPPQAGLRATVKGLVQVAFYSLLGSSVAIVFYALLWSAWGKQRSLPMLCQWTLLLSLAVSMLAAGATTYRRRKGGLLYTGLGLAALVLSVSYFGEHLFGELPTSVGGGQPRAVRAIVTAEAALALREYGGLVSVSRAEQDGSFAYLVEGLYLVDLLPELYLLTTCSALPENCLTLSLKKDHVQSIIFRGSSNPGKEEADGQNHRETQGAHQGVPDDSA
jgi:hypothetical protein